MKKILAATIALAFGFPLAANAAEGWVVADISLQAGPDTEYPSITELPAGSPVSIQGCIDGWTWCDVVAGNDRGWVPGTFLEEEYQNRRVVVVDYGPQIHIPVVTFSIGSYWDQHYRSRPFYTQRQEFSARPIHPHAPPRPSQVATSTQGSSSPAQRRDASAPTTATTSANAQTATSGQQNTRAAANSSSANTTSSDAASAHAAGQERPTREHATTQTEARTPQPANQPERRPAAQAQAAPEQAPPPVPESKQVRTAQQHATDQPKQRQGEPKAKDELKKPPQKQGKDDKDKNGDNGGG